VTAYEAALQEITRERDPFTWVVIQTNVGNAEFALGSLSRTKFVSGKKAIEAARVSSSLLAMTSLTSISVIASVSSMPRSRC
jgi:hypothetical protein